MIPLAGVRWAGLAATSVTALYGADEKVNSMGEVGTGGAVVRATIPGSSCYLGPAAKCQRPLVSMGGGQEMLQWDGLWS